MARILVLQHGKAQTPGRLGATLRDHGFRLDVRKLWAKPGEGGDPLPQDLDGIHGLISLGGPQNVDEPHWWLKPELELIRAAHERELPVIGSCLGHQLVAMALGGTVERMAVPEVGFCRVDIGFAGQTDTILAGVPWSAEHFFSHAYAVTQPPAGAQVLASSAASRAAIMKAGMRTYGFQYHFECDAEMIGRIATEAKALFDAAGVSAEALTEQTDARYGMFARAADRVCLNLAAYAFSFADLLSA